jgi:hypothetical protein
MDYRGAPQNGSAWQSGDTPFRVLRGGSWYSVPEGLRSAVRNRSFPIIRHPRLRYWLSRCQNAQAARCGEFSQAPKQAGGGENLHALRGVVAGAQDFRCRLAFGKCEALLDDH